MQAIPTFYYRHDEEIPAYLNKRPGKDAGYDLFAAETVWLWPFQTKTVQTNSFIHIPEGHFGRVCGRSGTAKRGWLTHPGTVDHGYAGQIGAIQTNINLFPRRIKKGERIAQLIFIPFSQIIMETEIHNEDHYTAMVAAESQSDRLKKAYNSSGR